MIMLPICPVCHLSIMPRDEVEIEWHGEDQVAHRWCSPTAEGGDDQGEDDTCPMTTDGRYAGEAMNYKVERVEDDDPAVLAYTVTVRLHPQQKDVAITLPAELQGETSMTNPTHPIAIYDMFMNHRAEIIGAARRAPKGYRVWAVVNRDGTWDGIYGPFQRGSWPSRVHGGQRYHISFSGNPFLSRDTFDDELYQCLVGWQSVYDDDLQALRFQRETEGQADV